MTNEISIEYIAPSHPQPIRHKQTNTTGGHNDDFVGIGDSKSGGS